MGLLKDTIKNNLLVHERQRSAFSYEKAVGEVIEVNEDNRTCTVQIIKGDNINEVIYNVQVQTMFDGLFDWFPEAGDYVDLKGYKGVYIITSSSFLANLGKTVNTSNYGDMFADNTSGGGGNCGI